MENMDRLTAFDQFAADVRRELDETARHMEKLRAENRVKSATYKQIFAIRSTLKEIDRRLVEHGLEPRRLRVCARNAVKEAPYGVAVQEV